MDYRQEEYGLQEEHISIGWDKNKMPAKQRNTRAVWLTCSHILIFLCSVVLFTKGSRDIPPNRETSHYSPLWGTSLEKQLKKVGKKLDGSLFDTNNPSKFRNSLHPSDAVEGAWAELEWIRTFPMAEEDVRKLGKDPDLVVKFPPEYGFGHGAYVAQLDIFHQLYCINLLRHIAWGDELHWIHVAHCTEVLRENLMCSANLDVITFNWKETQDFPFADFNLNKKCTNAEILMDWQKKHTLATERARNFTRPPGAREVPLGDEYFRIYGVERVD